MEYLITVIFLFLSFLFLSVLDLKWVGLTVTHRVNRRDTMIISAVTVVFLVLFVTFRPDTMPDYKSYIDDFKNLDKYRDLSLELGDKTLINIVHLITPQAIYVFFVFALIGQPLKIAVIRKMAPFYFLSMAVFVTGILIAQDMVAIRSAIAVGFFFWALKYKFENKIWYCVLFSILSILFHYSAVIIFLPLFLFSVNKPYRVLYGLLIPISYALVIGGLGITQFFDLISVEIFQQLWAYYKFTDEEDAYNIFNLFLLGRCIFYYFILFRIDRIKQHYPAAILLMKIYCLSIVLTILLYESQSMAIRVAEFLGSVEIFLIPSILYSFKRRNLFIGYGLCFIYCSSLLLRYGVYFFE